MLDESFSLFYAQTERHTHKHITCFCTLGNLISFALSVHQLHRDSLFTITLHKYSNEMQNLPSLFLSIALLSFFPSFSFFFFFVPSFRFVVIESNSFHSHFFKYRNALVQVCLPSLSLPLNNNCLTRSRSFSSPYPPPPLSILNGAKAMAKEKEMKTE